MPIGANIRQATAPKAAGDMQAPIQEPPGDRRAELKAFLFLTVVMAPAIAGVVIGTYGLLVWIYQMFAGPPTG